ncbi:hypothetical protein DL240490_03923 [Mycobacterium marinum]|nr:hypothetical protein DL240490_03923 [Mycobacterium marinum]
MRGHFDVDSGGETVAGAYDGDQLVDLVGGPGDHGLAWRVVDAQRDLWVVGDQRLGLGRVELQEGHTALSGQWGHQPRAHGGHPQSFGGGQCSGDHGGGDLAHGVADDQVGLDSVGTPQLGEGELHADQT